VPPYLLLIGFLLFAPTNRLEAKRRTARRAVATELYGGSSDATRGELIACADASDTAERELLAGPATKVRRSKARIKPKPAAAIDPAPVTWVRVGPGKFVRVEGAAVADQNQHLPVQEDAAPVRAASSEPAAARADPAVTPPAQESDPSQYEAEFANSEPARSELDSITDSQCLIGEVPLNAPAEKDRTGNEPLSSDPNAESEACDVELPTEPPERSFASDTGVLRAPSESGAEAESPIDGWASNVSTDADSSAAEPLSAESKTIAVPSSIDDAVPSDSYERTDRTSAELSSWDPETSAQSESLGDELSTGALEQTATAGLEPGNWASETSSHSHAFHGETSADAYELSVHAAAGYDEEADSSADEDPGEDNDTGYSAHVLPDETDFNAAATDAGGCEILESESEPSEATAADTEQGRPILRHEDGALAVDYFGDGDSESHTEDTIDPASNPTDLTPCVQPWSPTSPVRRWVGRVTRGATNAQRVGRSSPRLRSRRCLSRVGRSRRSSYPRAPPRPAGSRRLAKC
jgi:hypothetical protein